MFNADFFPTPDNVINQMTEGIDLENKIILEPSAGSGAIIDHLQAAGASVICCENDPRLKVIAKSKCKHIADDFLKVTPDQISHIHAIVMNPPFSKGVDHVLHAYHAAPKGCKIVSLINSETIRTPWSQSRKELAAIIEAHGQTVDLGQCFAKAERETWVGVTMVTINKPGESYTQEFEGFFTDEEPEEHQEDGIMQYNAVRDLVNRYVAAVKLYDEQIETGKKMNALLSGFYGSGLTFTCTEGGAPKFRNDFKTDLQKAGWAFIFSKMNLNKYATAGLREDLNKFVEQQKNIPFTMRNIYRMIDIVIGTNSQRMDKAILEAFDTITQHHADNRHHIKGWKTNSHYLVGKKFILPNCVSPAKEYGCTSVTYSYLNSSKTEKVDDLEKALCFVLGINYDELSKTKDRFQGEDVTDRKEQSLRYSIHRNTYGEYYDSYFFRYKAFKNGNMHFEFRDEDTWAKFNQRIAKIKGYPLFEGKAQTAYQNRQTGRAKQEKRNPADVFKPSVLFEFNL